MSEIYDTDKEFTHDDYIGFGLKRFAQLMNCDDINQYCKKHADDGAEVKWDEGASNCITLAGVSSKPDFTYEDNERLWIGEAKANLKDVNKHNANGYHLETQLVDYLTFMSHQNKKDKRIIVSCPFDASSIVMQHIDSAFNECRENNIKLDGIKTELVYQTVDSIIKPPENFESMVPGTVIGHGSEMIFGRMVPYDIVCMSTMDPDLLYNAFNTRLFGFSSELTQDDCHHNLLSESYAANASNGDKLINHSRKDAFMRYGMITKPLDVNMKSEHDNIVIDGNSRLANARDILAHSKAAKGYETVTCRVFHNLSDDESDYLKEHEQHQQISPHPDSRIALKMWEYKKEKHMSFKRIHEIYDYIQKPEFIPIYVDSVDACFQSGYSKQDVSECSCYYTAYNVVSAYKNNKLSQPRQNIVNRVLANPEFNNKNASALYALMSSVNAGANQNKILDKFVKGEYNDPAVLNDDLKAAKNGDIDDYNNVRTTLTNFAKPPTDKLRAVSLNGYTAEQLIAKHYTEDSIDEMLEQNDALHDVTGVKHDELINAKRKLHEYEERRNPSLFTGIDD